MSGNVIETHDLTLYYGRHRGIQDVELSVAEGEVFGFLGLNGAGKTTTQRVLLDPDHRSRYPHPATADGTRPGGSRPRAHGLLLVARAPHGATIAEGRDRAREGDRALPRRVRTDAPPPLYSVGGANPGNCYTRPPSAVCLHGRPVLTRLWHGHCTVSVQGGQHENWSSRTWNTRRRDRAHHWRGFVLRRRGQTLGIEGSVARQVISLALPIAALIGWGIAPRSGVVGGLLMVVSAAGILIVLEIGVFSLITAIPIGIGALLAFIGSATERKPASA